MQLKTTITINTIRPLIKLYAVSILSHEASQQAFSLCEHTIGKKHYILFIPP